MPVATTNAYDGPYVGNGVTTEFPFSFTVLTAADVSVDVDGADVTSGFTVSPNGTAGAASAGGTVVFDSPVADGSQVVIYLDPAFTQNTEFADGSPWKASPYNNAYDKAALRDQVLLRETGRALKLPFGDPAAGSFVLPSVVARRGSLLGFDADGKPIPSAGTGTDSALRSDLATPAAGARLIAPEAGGTLQDYLNNIGYAGPVTASFTGVPFGNTGSWSAAQFLTNGATPFAWYSAAQGGLPTTDGFTSAVLVPATATNHQTNGFSAYVKSLRAQPGNGGDVAAYTHAIAAANGSAVFALNTVAEDTAGMTGQTIGIELDYNVNAADTNVNGINMVIVGNIALTGNRNAYACRGAFSSNSQWSNGFVSADGAVANYALFIGSQTASPGTARQSQKIGMVSYAADNTRYIGTIGGDSTGGMQYRPGSALGAHAFQDPTGSNNWAFVNADGMHSPRIFLGILTFAQLPTAVGNAGCIALVTDSNTGVKGSAAAGGGTTFTLVASDGVQWRVC
jgi:hypothetical protein